MSEINYAGGGDHSPTPLDKGPRIPIACVGASAGGVDALQRLFSQAPRDLGIGFVVLQHLAPDRESLLAELLDRISTLSVEQATDGIHIAPNHVFVIPPNSLATIKHGCVRLVPAETPHGRHQIDELMRSLAEDLGDEAIGIVLSGTGEDGTEGLGAIRAHGGLAITQAPTDAQFDGMPRSAAASGNAEYILPISGIIEMLERYVDRVSPVRINETGESSEKVEEGLEQLFARLCEQAGHDFRHYKRSTILRRIRRRMDAHQLASFEKYVTLALQEPQEIEHLGQDLLIGVTQFFRDTEVFDELTIQIASIVSQRAGQPGAGMRVWVVGCATGEEAYSIGILIREQMANVSGHFTNQIFATDIDEHALDVARRGVSGKDCR